jgi:uncharacterized protein (DUF2252 family)
MIMAWDLAHVPHGEHYVQACGDAHLCNFGVFGTPERRLIFDLRDFDETLPGPWEWDVKRLAASIAVAARELGLSSSSAEDAVLRCVRSYRETMRASLDKTYLEAYYLRVDSEEILANAKGKALSYARKSFKKARRRTSMREFKKLVSEIGGELKIKEDRPLIFPVHDLKIEEEISSVLDAYRATLPLNRRLLLEHYHLVDLAYRVVGVGSVGTRCLIALLLGDATDDPLILQIKEAKRSVLEPYVRRCRFQNQGERVVQGQRRLQAASGLLLGWKSRSGHDFYVRQLKDMKGTVDLDEIPSAILEPFSGLCGRTLAHAHARTGDFSVIAGYLGKSDQFDVAIAEFAHDYADQTELDHAALVKAVRQGRLPAEKAA